MFKNNDSKNNESRKKSNPCKKPGHDHDWDDCPDKWKNKKKSSNCNQEKHNIEKDEKKSKRGFLMKRATKM